MSTQETAQQILALLKAGKFDEAGKQFWADDVVSIEPMEGDMAVLRGKAAVQGKSDWWFANHEVHSATANGPYVNGDQFAVTFAIDVTAKANGQRMQMEEVGLYTLKDGKIAEERFFFRMG
jgi:ketosteroid isomerase-like protein